MCVLCYAIAQVERKLDAAQESIIDQQQTIEKFRELVRSLQSDISELRERGERGTGSSSGSGLEEAQRVMNLNVQLKSTVKAHARVSASCSMHVTVGGLSCTDNRL